LSKYAGLGKLIGRIALMCALGVVGGYLVAQSINKANAAGLSLDQELLVEFLLKEKVTFMLTSDKLIVYADQDGNVPEWLTCNYIQTSVSDAALETITVKDYTASSTLKEEICK